MLSAKNANKIQEPLKRVLVQEGHEERFFLLGSGLVEEEERKLETFLRENIEVFTWTLYEMLGSAPRSPATNST